MWQYLVTFSFSCMFAGMADYFYKFRHRRYFLISSFLAIYIGALLAGLRASSVGTDVMTYGHYIFRSACGYSSLLDFVQEDTSIEPLYLVLNFVVSRLTKDVHWFYFALHYIMMSFVYAGLVDLKKRTRTEIWLGLFVFYMTFYGFSLNGMRQSAAACILFWNMRFLYDRHFGRFCLGVLLAMGFHYTACIFLAVYFLYVWIEKSKNKKLAVIVIVMGFIVVALGFRYIMAVVATIVPKYRKHLIMSEGNYSIKPAIVRMPFPLLMILFYKIYKRKNTRTDFWMVLLLGDIIFAMLRGISATVYRMSYYFAIVKMGAYPFLCQAFNKRSQLIVKLVLVLVLLIIWYYQVVLQGNDEVYPYVSDVWTWLN